MSDDMGLYDDALDTFFAEANEMLQQIEDTLLILETDPNNRETINALFRAAHTIKGSAGLFGLNRIVNFTHQVESVLDRVRKNEITIDPNLSNALLKSSDILSELLQQAQDKGCDAASIAASDQKAALMTEQLMTWLDDKRKTGSNTPATPASSSGTWHISLRFGENTFRNGFDPLSVVGYLRTLGQIQTLLIIEEHLPHISAFDPESCYLGFEVSLQSQASRAEIDAAFEFVRDDCTIRILPPNRRVSDFLNLLRDLPKEARLGDLLVDCGAISRQALDEALMEQKNQDQNERRQGRPQGQPQGQHSTDNPATTGNNSANSANPPGSQLGQILIAQNKVASEVVEAALSKQGKKDGKPDESRFVRVPADKLDALINLVGELVICGASASLLAQRLRETQLIETTQQMSGLVEEIRNGTLALRMVQIGETFARYKRVVRDTAAELGKEIHLEIEGAETELDKSVVEKIGDPLMHLVRNAMDHGIELPETRLAAGKPAVGTLHLSAHHDSGHIVIEVSDDGRGLDGEKILAKARERGIVGPNQVLSELEKLNLIFEPGFSTAEKVTNLSGRGVGMDVVRRNIEALRGSVTPKTIVGQGSTIEIRLPLTLAIIDGFLVRVGRSSYVIPLHAVVECIDSDASQLQGHSDWSGTLNLRGEVLPFLELRKIFNIQDALSERRSVVVVRNGEMAAGLVVDQLLGEYQTVIKPLGKLFQKVRGISGGTVLGSGEVALILDVPSLVRLAGDRETHVQ
jgi:two-component system, chemotaxis family, sensor kinase CheA